MEIGHEVEVATLPNCDFCSKIAFVDGRTTFGPWGYMCIDHYKKWGVGTGTGRGQRLIERKQ